MDSRENFDPSSPGAEEAEDGILLEKPYEIRDDNLDSLLPSIRAVVTAYADLKSEQSFGKANLKDIPLNKLKVSSVTNEQTIRAVIIELQQDKQALVHGAVKTLEDIFGDSSALSPQDKEQKKTPTEILLQALAKKTRNLLVGFLDVPVKAFSVVLESYAGISASDQQQIACQLVSTVVGETKAQHIVEIIDSCIQAKDCQGEEKKCDKLIARIKEIGEIHVPSQDNFRRLVCGRNVNFETVFLKFCDNAIALIENIKKYKPLQAEKSVNGGTPSSLVSVSSSSDFSVQEEKKKENVKLSEDIEKLKEELEEEKKSNEEKERKLQESILTSRRECEAKLTLEAKARDLEKELKLSNLKLNALIENNNDSKEFLIHTIELKDSKNKYFLLFAGAGGSSGLCLLYGVGISAWWLIPVGLFIGGVYYAYNSYKKYSQAEIVEKKVTLREKSILQNSTAILALKLKNQEQKDQEQKSVAFLSEIKSCLSYLDELLGKAVILNAPKKIQQEIYGIFQSALNTLKLEPITEGAIAVTIQGACEALVLKRQRSRPYFFGKTQHQEIDVLIAGLKQQVHQESMPSRT